MNATTIFERFVSTLLLPFLVLAGVACGGGSTADGTSEYDADPEPGFFGSDPADREETIPAGTILSVRLDQGLSSADALAGQPFSGRLAEPVVLGGDVVLQTNTVFRGKVLEVQPAKRIGGRARLNLLFTSLEHDGRDVPITGFYYSESKSQTKKDAATIGGAAVGGAVVGRVIGHERGDEADGTAVGAAVGAAIGSAVAASNKGQEVTLPEGALVRIELEAPVTIAV